MKVVVGLGNPGFEYENTRHNVGFWFIDYLAHRYGFDDFLRVNTCLVTEGLAEGLPFLLVKPILYMNRSGQAISALWRAKPFNLDNLLVCYDDVALPVGTLRIRARGSAGGHNGMDSIIEALGTEDCARLRFGVAGAKLTEELTDYVLSPFAGREEDAVLDRFEDAAASVKTIFTEGLEKAMSLFNSKYPPEDTAGSQKPEARS